MRGFILAAVILVCCATPAMATVTVYDFKGTVVSGSDDDGIFGPFGANLSGRPYDLRITVNSATGGTVAGAPYIFSLGGSGGNAPLQVRLKIGSNSYTLNDFGNTLSYFSASDPLDHVDFTSGGSNYLFSFGSSNSSGYYNALTYGRPNSGGSNGFRATLGDADDTILRLGAAVVPTISGAPEPATWAMLLGGFGLCGAALRRRSRPLRPGLAAAR